MLLTGAEVVDIPDFSFKKPLFHILLFIYLFIYQLYIKHIGKLTVWSNEQRTPSIGGLPDFTKEVFRKQ